MSTYGTLAALQESAFKTSNPFEELVRLPWWSCALLAVLSFGLMHHLAGIQLGPTNGLGEEEGNWQYARMAAFFAQFLLPLAFAAAAAGSAYEQWRRRESVNQQQLEEMLLTMAKHEGDPKTEPPLMQMPGPSCPECGKAMRRRVARRSATAKPFWGCTSFPLCRGTLPVD